MICDRCKKKTPDDKYNCVHCDHRNPHMSEAHNRWNDWTCPKCRASNGGAFRRCAKCNERNPN